jgi:hypothetical protein
MNLRSTVSLLLAFTLTVTSGCVRQASAVPGNLISPEELPAESLRAADGDPVAADKVARYYSFADPSNKAGDFWIAVARENGSITWMDFEARRLAYAGGRYNCRRGLYWIRRAISLHPDKLDFLQRTLRTLEKMPDCQP